ncbi:MAG TPA: UDP-N-acetylglucosamine--N-acetylmuramyl-(pentapeptide) pyrophosphoryl-undecaprenol N-acetylglucosamine transferase [Acidimicrobiales bacterium]|nr:UDP-N-acetylglucosamine--N-acetylmuramyl-(pentapeptide) pyrophosphoryl-undecaprenol N-acetylglucosamine transferase [Acidimicrobiales bacterium]
MSERFAVVAGGGTGGHVFPALAVARALSARGHPRSSIELVGSARGEDAALLAEEGFPVTTLPGRGLRRSLAPGDLAENARALYQAGSTVGQMRATLGRWQPSVVVSVGGYASFAAGAAAVLGRVPLVLVQVDAVPGLVHRLLGRFATASATAFADSGLPRATVTGTPVRDELGLVDRSAEAMAKARVALGLAEDRTTVGVVSGSLGSRRVNRAVVDLAGRWAERDDLALYHVTGRRDFDEVVADRPPSLGDPAAGPSPGRLDYRVVPFCDQMPLFYGAADVVVSRAGAMTVAELTLVGVPAVLVPLPGAPADHQHANARVLVAHGAAVLLPDADCTGHQLEVLLGRLLAQPAELRSMGEAAHRLGRPGAAERVADVVEAAVAGRVR